jgi:hypothetical protein
MIESFTGNQFSAEAILANINHPRNAFNVEMNARDKFDGLGWGIGATIVDGQVKGLIVPQTIRGLKFKCNRPNTCIAKWLQILVEQ